MYHTAICIHSLSLKKLVYIVYMYEIKQNPVSCDFFLIQDDFAGKGLAPCRVPA